MVSVVSRVPLAGPLERYVREFAAELDSCGHTPLAAVNQLGLMAHLSRWLAAEGPDPSELNDEGLQLFLAARSGQGYTCWLSLRGSALLLGCLRGLGVVPASTSSAGSGPAENLLAECRTHLAGERGLVADTIRAYDGQDRLFLSRIPVDDLHDLRVGHVTGFVVDECGTRSSGSAKILVTALRSLLRWLLLTGRVDRDLAQAVPAVAVSRQRSSRKG